MIIFFILNSRLSRKIKKLSLRLSYMERDKIKLNNINMLVEFFSKITKENPDIIFFGEESRSFSQIQLIIPIIDKLSSSYKGNTPLFKLQRIARRLLEKEISKDTPLILPLGFKLENDFHIDFIIQALEYHFIEQSVSMFRIIFRSAIPDSQSKKTNEQILDKILGFFKQVEGFEDGMKDNLLRNFFKDLDQQFNIKEKILPYVESFLGFSKPEMLISDYCSTYDTIISFFAKPIYDNLFADKPTSNKELLDKIRELLGDEYAILFERLEPSWRNAFVHKNYIIDKQTNEIVYFQASGPRYENISFPLPIPLQRLEGDLIFLKMCLMGLLSASFVYLTTWIAEQSKEITPYTQIFYPETDFSNELDLLTNIFSEIVTISSLKKEKKELESILLDMITFFRLNSINHKFESNIIDKKLLNNDFDLCRYLEDSKLKDQDIEVIIGYLLALISSKTYLLPEHKVKSIINNLLRSDFVKDLNSFYFELFIALSTNYYGLSINYFKQALIGKFSFNDDEIQNIIDQLNGEEYDKLNFDNINDELNIIIQIWRICKEISLLRFVQVGQISEIYVKFRKELIKNLPTTAVLLIEILKKEQKTLTLYQITNRIRKQDEEWPSPDFSRPGDCARYLEKLGVIFIERNGDYKLTLVPDSINFLRKHQKRNKKED